MEASSSAKPRLQEPRGMSGISNKLTLLLTLRSFRNPKQVQMAWMFSLVFVLGMFMSAKPTMWQSRGWQPWRLAFRAQTLPRYLRTSNVFQKKSVAMMMAI